MKFNPATVRALRELMLAGLDPGRGAGPLHCCLRYFDPVRRRAGVPEDVAALIDEVSDQHCSVTLVNVNQTRARTVVVQAGAYGEHQCVRVETEGRQVQVGRPYFTVRLAAGAGARLVIQTDRYANDPTLEFPWDRGWKKG